MPRSDHHHPEYPVLDLSKDVEDKRAKREIANMNERRRMQNINSGFHSLRALLPHKHDGEKLSKAAILQHTATYIYQLEQEISKLLSQNSELKRALGGTAMSQVSTNTPEWIKRFASEPPDCPSCKRRKFDDSNRHMDLSPMGTGEGGSSTESSSEQEVNAKFRARKQNGSNGKNGSGVDQSLRKQLIRVEKELEEERRLRRMLEEELGYQSKPSIPQNGRAGNHHYSGLDTTIVADEVEVASESIEIEMHSCPASPPDALALPPIEQSVPPSTVSTVYMANQHRTSVISSSSLEMNHKMLEQQQRAAKQNAIALPIDVPFVAPREVVVTETDESKPQVVQTTTANGGQMVLLLDKGGQIMSILDPSAIQTTSSGSSSATPQIIHLVSSTGDGNSSSSVSSSNGNPNPNPKTSSVVVMSSSQPDDSIITTANSVPTMSSTQKQALLEEPPESAQTSRQNLNTIVEAIRHLEGDHLFESTSKQLAKQNHLFFH